MGLIDCSLGIDPIPIHLSASYQGFFPCQVPVLLKYAGELILAVPKLVKLAEKGTERNRRLGKWRGSSFGSFREKLKDWVADVTGQKRRDDETASNGVW